MLDAKRIQAADAARNFLVSIALPRDDRDKWRIRYQRRGENSIIMELNWLLLWLFPSQRYSRSIGRCRWQCSVLKPAFIR